MSDFVIDTTEQYQEASKRADALGDFGKEVVDLPAIRRSCFIQGYASALIDMKYGKDRRKLLKPPFASTTNSEHG